MLAVTRFVSLMLGALNLGLAFAHLMEMGPKRAMTGTEWLTTQQIYRNFGRAAGITFPVVLLSALTSAFLVRRQRATALLTVFGTACEAITVLIWARFNEPVNKEIVQWKAKALPSNWAERRDRWEFAHATSAAVHAIGLGALTAAALRDGEGDKT